MYNKLMHRSWGFARFLTLSIDWHVISFSTVIVPQHGDHGVSHLVSIR